MLVELIFEEKKDVVDRVDFEKFVLYIFDGLINNKGWFGGELVVVDYLFVFIDFL